MVKWTCSRNKFFLQSVHKYLWTYQLLTKLLILLKRGSLLLSQLRNEWPCLKKTLLENYYKLCCEENKMLLTCTTINGSNWQSMLGRTTQSPTLGVVTSLYFYPIKPFLMIMIYKTQNNILWLPSASISKSNIHQYGYPHISTESNK